MIAIAQSAQCGFDFIMCIYTCCIFHYAELLFLHWCVVPFRGNGNGVTRNVHTQLGLLGGTGHWWSLEYMFFCEKPTCFWLPTRCTLHVALL